MQEGEHDGNHSSESPMARGLVVAGCCGGRCHTYYDRSIRRNQKGLEREATYKDGSDGILT